MRPRTMATIFINLYSQKNDCRIAEDRKKSWMNEPVKKVHTQEYLSARVGSYSKKAPVQAKGREEGAYNSTCERDWESCDKRLRMNQYSKLRQPKNWFNFGSMTVRPYLKDGGGGFVTHTPITAYTLGELWSLLGTRKWLEDGTLPKTVRH